MPMLARAERELFLRRQHEAMATDDGEVQNTGDIPSEGCVDTCAIRLILELEV
jgi:hypothetical protein